MVPLRFELLVDPLETLIVSENDLEHSADVRWNTQSSGVRLSERAAREIDKWLGVAELVTSSSAIAPGRHERVVELNARDQGLVRELKRIYEGKCQICASELYDGKFGSITEAHHIHWLSRDGADTLENMVLLCPNHHAAVHAVDAEFDWNRLAFKLGTALLPLRMNEHLVAT